MTKRERDAVIRGVAEFVRDFDGRVLHPWRLSDCILLKFNVSRKRAPRRNSLEWLGWSVDNRTVWPQPRKGGK